MKKLLVILMVYSMNAIAGGDGENKIPPPLPPIGKITAPTPAAETNQSKAADCAPPAMPTPEATAPKNDDCKPKVICQCEPKTQPKPVTIVKWRTKVDNGAAVKLEQELADAKKENDRLRRENDRLQGYLAQNQKNDSSWGSVFKPVQKLEPVKDSSSNGDGEISLSVFGGVGPDGILPFRYTDESGYTDEEVRLGREFGPVFGGMIDYNAFSRVKFNVMGISNNTWLIGAGFRFNKND